MKVQKINEGTITADDIKAYKEAISKLDGFVFNAADVDMDKRIITIRLGNVDEELVLVNPKILQLSDKPLVYFEKDTYKQNKVRKTVRYPWIVLDTDNLGKVEFKATSETMDWKNADEFFGDVGLLEAILVQRALDAIDGIDITHPQRQYSETITKDKEPGRNERVMLQGPDGEMEFVKSKKVDSYLQKGWNLI
jgi:peptide deformylase